MATALQQRGSSKLPISHGGIALTVQATGKDVPIQDKQ